MRCLLETVTGGNILKIYKNVQKKGTSIETLLLQRVYLLLIIFDTLESCLLGTPKLLSFALDAEKMLSIFQVDSSDNLHLKTWEMFELLTSLTLHRVTISILTNAKTDCDITSMIWVPREDTVLPVCINNELDLFKSILLVKQELISALLAINGKTMIPQNLFTLVDKITLIISLILKLLRLMETGEISREETPRFMDGMIRQELSNIIEIIKPVPSQLINHFLQKSAEVSDLQQLIFKLSTCMNDIVQITGLLRLNVNVNVNGSAVKVKVQSELREVYGASFTESGDDPCVDSLVGAGWSLLDDTELGWLTS